MHACLAESSSVVEWRIFLYVCLEIVASAPRVDPWRMLFGITSFWSIKAQLKISLHLRARHEQEKKIRGYQYWAPLDPDSRFTHQRQTFIRTAKVQNGSLHIYEWQQSYIGSRYFSISNNVLMNFIQSVWLFSHMRYFVKEVNRPKSGFGPAILGNEMYSSVQLDRGKDREKPWISGSSHAPTRMVTQPDGNQRCL